MPAASTTVLELGGTMITTFVDLITVVITNFWPYILGISALVGLYFFLRRHAGIGTK
jgi:hypothetical protein